MPNMDLLVRVSDLAALRRVAAEKKQALAEKQAAFNAEHAVEIETVKLATQAVENAETALLAVALDVYNADKSKNKKLAPGLEIKMFDVLHYDPVKAFAWGKKAETAITPEALDEKAFKKIAKASPGTAGSYITTEPRAQIATDLDKALSSVEAAADASQVTV